jgi:hypothetical protein
MQAIVVFTTNHRESHVGRKLILLAALVAVAGPALAETATVEVTQPGWLQYVNAGVSGLLALGLGWLGLILKNKWGIEIDAKQRELLAAFLSRQAASLVADGFVRINQLKVLVDHPALVAAARTALTAIPDALKHFGLTPDKLEAMIVDKIPVVPSVAAVAGAQAAPPVPLATSSVVVEAAAGSAVETGPGNVVVEKKP